MPYIMCQQDNAMMMVVPVGQANDLEQLQYLQVVNSSQVDELAVLPSCSDTDTDTDAHNCLLFTSLVENFLNVNNTWLQAVMRWNFPLNPRYPPFLLSLPVQTKTIHEQQQNWEQNLEMKKEKWIRTIKKTVNEAEPRHNTLCLLSWQR